SMPDCRPATPRRARGSRLAEKLKRSKQAISWPVPARASLTTRKSSTCRSIWSHEGRRGGRRGSPPPAPPEALPGGGGGGVRRLAPTFGETIVVIGLGLLGQITCQLLKAAGCVVIAADIDDRRVAMARRNGIDHGLATGDGGLVEQVIPLTDGHGADGVIIT